MYYPILNRCFRTFGQKGYEKNGFEDAIAVAAAYVHY